MAKVVFITVLLAVLGALLLVEGLPATSRTGDIKILKFNQIQDENSYKFEFENSDGQKRSEAGGLNTEEGGSSVIGQYSFIDKNKLYIVSYEAGRSGFKPTITVTDL